jgi:hypothetical protein
VVGVRGDPDTRVAEDAATIMLVTAHGHPVRIPEDGNALDVHELCET